MIKKNVISVMLAITANGSKLAPYLIFKAKQNGIIEKDLKMINMFYQKNSLYL